MLFSGRQRELLTQLITSDKAMSLVHGPIGTAKTTVGCMWLLATSYRCYGQNFGLLGVTQQQVTSGPLSELQKLSSGVTRKNDKLYYLPSGCGQPNKLHIFTANRAGDSQRIRSYNLAGGYVDELTLMPPDAFSNFIGRMRSGFKNPRVVCTTNPSGAGHWVYDRFMDEDLVDPEIVEHMPTTHADNPSLPDNYVQKLEAVYTGHQRERMVHGVWASVTGTAFPHCIKNITDNEPNIDDIIGIDIGLDVGESSVTHGVQVSRLANGESWVTGEWVYDHQKNGPLSSEQKLVGCVTHLASDPNIPLLSITIDRNAVQVLDIASYDYRGTMTEVYGAYDRHAEGVDICEHWAYIRGLHICRKHAPVLCRELPKVVWDELYALVGEDRLAKNIPRHGVDAMRYVISQRHIREQGGALTWDLKRRSSYAI